MSIPGSLAPLFNSGAGGAAGYQIERSLRFNSADSANLSRTPAVAGNRTTWTWAGWVKRQVSAYQQIFTVEGATAGNYFQFAIENNDKIAVRGASNTGYLMTTQVLRDPSAWYHIVLAVDTTQSTPSNTLKLFLNGSQITTFDSSTYPSQNTDLNINTTNLHWIGRAQFNGYGASHSDCYLADIHFIDGQALTPSSFTEVSATTGQLIPKAYAGTYTGNSFWLKFSDNSAATAATLGKDSFLLGNNWTPNNLSTTTGGPTSVAAASGALPVFNTTDTYGTVKGTGTRTDTNSASIVLALPMDGTNGGTSFGDQSAVIRGSGSAKTVTVNGNTNTSTAQSKFYGSSGYFDGTGDWLETPHSADFTLSRSASTMECWVYPTNLSSQRIVLDKSNSGATNQSYGVRINTNGTVLVEWIYPGGGSSASLTSALTVSTNIWSHISVVTSSNTLYVYVDGIRDANTTALSNDAQSTTSTPFRIGSTYNSSNQFLGYIQDVRVYTTAKYTGNFNPPSSTANSTIAAGNDSLVDTPTSYGTDTYVGGEVRGNYATFNPLALGSYASLTNGNLDITGNNSENSSGSLSTVGFTSGKYYYEYVASSAGSVYGGVVTFYSNDTSTLIDEGNVFGRISANKGIGIRGLGNIQGNAAEQQSIAAFTYSAGEVIGVAIDADYGAVYFSKSGSFLNSGVPTSGASRTGSFHNWTPSSSRICYPAVTAYLGGSGSASANFGQRAFAHPVSGFKALCDTNLPAPLTAKPNTLMDVALYTGNGSTQTISGLNFSSAGQTGLVWIKSRSSGTWHNLTDAVRGVNKSLFSNSTIAETAETDIVTALSSTGFTLGADANADGTNISGASYAAWCWATAAQDSSSHTQGSITSQVRANVSAGFSVVTYTGTGANATVGHGGLVNLSSGMIIVKSRTSSARQWPIYHAGNKGTGNNLNPQSSYIYLNLTNSAPSSGYSGFWNDTAPTSTVFSVGTDGGTNASGENFVAYCFAPVVGYSSFGSYTGNGSADGPFVYTGFRPAFFMVKASSTTGPWIIYDSKRPGYNSELDTLSPDSSAAEDSSGGTTNDIVSNGFKIRGTTDRNASAVTYIYYAVAENPFQYARAR